MSKLTCYLLFINVISAICSISASGGCKGDPNAISVPCGDPCPRTCENKDDPYERPCLTKCIINGCKCKPGFILNKDKKCIPIKNCPVYCTGLNEYYSECTSDCPDCCLTTDGERTLPCLMSLVCHPGCSCLPGFIRDANRKCIRPDQCPPFECTHPNKEFSKCGDGCPKTCANTVGGDFLYCMGLCRPDCICKEGFVKTNQGECIEPRLCPIVCHGENMIYKECGTACPKTCANKHLNIKCIEKCVPGCFCIDGYVLNSSGRCVLPGNCPNVTKCTGQNEQFSDCGFKCQTTCGNFGKNIPCNTCVPGCVCNRFFVRNEKSVCIKPTKCKNNVCPKPNEEYSDCVSPCAETCATLGRNITCNFLVCNPGCDCKPGFFRNPENVCVPRNKCGCGGDPNAEFAVCGDTCAVTCENRDKGPPICPRICIKGGGCRCKPDFIRSYRDKCILPEECPQCGKNEFFDCGSACDTTCATLGKPCPIVNVVCNEMCYCIKGYARDENNVCIPIKQCPQYRCGKNEIWKDCGTCDRTCKNPNPRCLYTKICRKGCYCKTGFVRHNGICIPKNKCPVICKGKNVEYSDCGSACPLTCDTLGADLSCIAVCVEGCFCKQGYVLNSAQECVLPEECDCSDPNAELISCANSCPGGTCAQPHFSPCKRACHPWACQCIGGFVKLNTTNRTCVEIESCP